MRFDHGRNVFLRASRLYRYVMCLLQGDTSRVDTLDWELTATAVLKLGDTRPEVRAEFGSFLKELWKSLEFEKLLDWSKRQNEIEDDKSTMEALHQPTESLDDDISHGGKGSTFFVRM